jgi:hypothetical protein
MPPDTLDSTTSRPTRRSSSWWTLPVVVLVVALGVWVTGGLLTDDERVARVLTGLWFALAGLVVLVLSWRHRSLAAPLVAGYLVVTVGLGGFLAYSSTVDRVVDEDVVVADVPLSAPTPSKGSAEPQNGDGSEVNVLLARGTFEPQAHPTEGTASVVRTSDRTVLTLTGFVTDPGPDLRVYLVPSGAEGVEGGIDIGALKGNKGDQQYQAPEGTVRGSVAGARVVIWCRAFSVAFGSARLA